MHINGSRWVHADPCEAALDAPLMYEAGWGKRLSYVFAFGAHEAVDVARRYAVSWPATLLRRAEVKEGWLELTIAALCEARQAALQPHARAALAARAATEQHQLSQRHERALVAAETRGRQTGALSWRRARGEAGEGGGEGGKGGGEGGDMARVVRVCGAAGGAVHGLCFEGADGRRAGSFLENSQAPRAAPFIGTGQPLLHTVAASTTYGRSPYYIGLQPLPCKVAACGRAACLPDTLQEPLDLYDDEGLVRRGGIWESLAPDECVVAAAGRTASMVSDSSSWQR